MNIQLNKARNKPINIPQAMAHSGRGPLRVLRRAKTVKQATEAQRDELLEDAERIETWAAWAVLLAIVLEATVWVLPLSHRWFKIGNFISDATVALGIYGEMRFGHVVSDILKIRLSEATERAAEAINQAAQADLARASLEKKVAPRRLSGEAMLTLFEELRDKIPPIYVRALGDSEVRQYAQDFFSSLLAIGLMIIDAPQETGVVNMPARPEKFGNLGFASSEQTHWIVGLHIYIPPGTASLGGLLNDPLVVALKKAGIPVSQVWSSEWPKPPITLPNWMPGNRILIVGEKPPDW